MTWLECTASTLASSIGSRSPRLATSTSTSALAGARGERVDKLHADDASGAHPASDLCGEHTVAAAEIDQ